MKHQLRLTTILASALFASAIGVSASANDIRSVTHDSRGQIVTNSFNNCVRSDTRSTGDECAPVPPPAPKPVAVVVPAPVKTTVSSLDKEARTVYFEFNKSNLTPASIDKLNTLTAAIKADTQFKDARIVGYADRIGSTSYNEKLSEKRAQAVQSYLVQHNIITLPNTETRWLGEADSITNCKDMKPRSKLIECLQKDRRVEVEIDYVTQSPAQ